MSHRHSLGQRVLNLFAPTPVLITPTAREARKSGLRVARAKAPTQMLEYIAALKQCGPASDHEIARVLGLPIATVNGRRADASQAYPGRIVVDGRVQVTHADGKRSSRTLWKWVA